MNSIAVILGVAICLVLLTNKGNTLSLGSSHDEHSIFNKHMLEDFADLLELRKESLQSHVDDPADYPKPKPGQVISPCSIPYSKYGCCQDGRTKALGPNKKGCGEALCADNMVAFCAKNRRYLDCSRGSLDSERCTFTCGCPKKHASPLQKCMARNTRYGCCWNGVESLEEGKTDCMPCINLAPHTCQQFKHISGGCLSGSYGIRSFMEKNCPKTCGVC